MKKLLFVLLASALLFAGYERFADQPGGHYREYVICTPGIGHAGPQHPQGRNPAWWQPVSGLGLTSPWPVLVSGAPGSMASIQWPLCRRLEKAYNSALEQLFQGDH